MSTDESEGRRDERSDSLVQLKGVTLRFGNQTILDQIDLEIPRGQTLVVIGESGCGKTMLLKVMIRLIDPTVGEVYFDGKLLRSLGDVELTALRQRMGFVFQNAALFDSMTIGQNVAFPLRLKEGLGPIQMRRMVLDRLAEVGLPDNVYEKRPNQLSGGMRKRVGLARALMLEPDLVLYDEPTTGLDPIMSDVINELMMRTRAKRSVTSVIVTHDMHTARKVADRVVMLYPLSRVRPGESQILFDGPPDQLDQSSDRRVRQFVDGQAGDRLMEMRRAREAGDLETPNLLDQMQD
jgi:phospholipid/cholesterol/gamma-HCH transport system ATP-binding protein